ncbi:MAG: hypothetical protein NZ660_12535 [Oscillatoriaceae bacterium SKYG93]|nr:hypothetical protein [Oscillatoriaceae bacterium SKYG93]MDW8454269.1 hypothetical protein [Oscillatoriaceae cyanobacterium SKYGB_i_bin93]HIK29133.1 hypothetical protein [Oscillatoriaceae cyanobacterium M7585_C2015_266]
MLAPYSFFKDYKSAKIGAKDVGLLVVGGGVFLDVFSGFTWLNSLFTASNSAVIISKFPV